MALTLDVTRRSASTTSAPKIRQTLEVAKLIDVSKCIGCKACQVACMEWNDVRDDVGSCSGVLTNPADLTDRAINKLIETEADSVQSVYPVGKNHPYWMKKLGGAR